MASTVRVISFKICPFVQRVTAALEARSVPNSVEFINLKDKPQWFLDISPTGQVPVVVTADTKTPLFESDAIVEYIDEKYGPLEKGLTLEQMALDRAWSYQAAKHYLVQCSTMRSSDDGILKERSAKLSKAFEKAEKHLTAINPNGALFKDNEQLSNVDIAWLPLLHRAAIIKKHSKYDFLSDFPRVQKWQDAMLKTGLADKSVSEDFEEAFGGFYLDPEATHLGKTAAELKA